MDLAGERHSRVGQSELPVDVAEHRAGPGRHAERLQVVRQDFLERQRAVAFTRLALRAVAKDDAPHFAENASQAQLGEHAVDSIELLLDVLQEEDPALPLGQVAAADDGREDREVPPGQAAAREALIQTIKAAATGQSPSPAGAMHSLAKLMKARQVFDEDQLHLTERETQVLRHVALGLSNKEIGWALEISVETVKEHVQNIFRKIGAKDRTQAGVWAIRNGLMKG